MKCTVLTFLTVPFLPLRPEAQLNGACANNQGEHRNERDQEDQDEQEEQGRPELVKPVEPAINEEHMTCVTGVDEMFRASHRVSWPCMFLLLLLYCDL